MNEPTSTPAAAPLREQIARAMWSEWWEYPTLWENGSDAEKGKFLAMADRALALLQPERPQPREPDEPGLVCDWCGRSDGTHVRMDSCDVYGNPGYDSYHKAERQPAPLVPMQSLSNERVESADNELAIQDPLDVGVPEREREEMRVKYYVRNEVLRGIGFGSPEAYELAIERVAASLLERAPQPEPDIGSPASQLRSFAAGLERTLGADSSGVLLLRVCADQIEEMESELGERVPRGEATVQFTDNGVAYTNPRDILASPAGRQQIEASAAIPTTSGGDALERALREIERLTACLARANEGFEEYERRFYLESDKVERVRAEAFEEAARTVMQSVGLLSLGELAAAIRALAALPVEQVPQPGDANDRGRASHR